MKNKDRLELKRKKQAKNKKVLIHMLLNWWITIRNLGIYFTKFLLNTKANGIN